MKTIFRNNYFEIEFYWRGVVFGLFLDDTDFKIIIPFFMILIKPYRFSWNGVVKSLVGGLVGGVVVWLMMSCSPEINYYPNISKTSQFAKKLTKAERSCPSEWYHNRVKRTYGGR